MPIKFISDMRSKGLNIDTVYDIGAHRGDWSIELKYRALPNAKFFLFEANPEYEERLKERNMQYFITTLSNPGRGEVDFYSLSNTGESYYKETTSHYDNVQPTKVQTQTLDDIIEKLNLPIPQFIKLDTQGSELDILRGAERNIMGKTEMIFTEMPIIEYNKGAPKFSDYMDYMRSFDYIPVELIGIHRSEETLMQVDIMFVLRSAKYEFLGTNSTIRV